jgi:hypothetical protein
MVSWVRYWAAKIILSSNQLKLYNCKDTFDEKIASFLLWRDYSFFHKMTGGVQDTNG